MPDDLVSHDLVPGDLVLQIVRATNHSYVPGLAELCVTIVEKLARDGHPDYAVYHAFLEGMTLDQRIALVSSVDHQLQVRDKYAKPE